MSWLYNEKEFILAEHDPEPFGYVYEITHTVSGKKYIGKKLLTKAGYKTIKGKRHKLRLESDWKEYYGSSPELKKIIEKEGTNNLIRQIVRLCYNRGECSYYESKMIFETDAIISDNYFNSWISVKVSAAHLNAGKNKKGVDKSSK